MRRTKSYYSTGVVDETHWYVQKLDPDLGLLDRYIVSKSDDEYLLCNCMAYVDECRHIKMIRKFAAAKQIGQHPPYDFDNDRYFDLGALLGES